MHGAHCLEKFSCHESIISDLEHLLLSWPEKKRHTILIVDDDPQELLILKTILEDYYILVAKNGIDALEVIKQNAENISIVIADQNMPLMEGTELFKKIALSHPHIVKILLTASVDNSVLQEAIKECHLYRYMLKSFEPKTLLESIECGITKYELSTSNNQIVHELSELFYKTIISIAFTLDAKDQYTHGHSFRVALYSLAMARALKLPDKTVEEAEIAGTLHDVGKIAIPDAILNKAGKLTNEEYAVIKKHPRQGFNLLRKVEKLKNISKWILYHHESLDGRGYPDGLSGEQIPIVSKIISIADSYDAMTSTRAYRNALSHEEAMAELRRASGIQFDSRLVEVFETIESDVKYIKQYPKRYCLKHSCLTNCFDVKVSLRAH